MGIIKSLVSIIIPIDDMTKPRKEASPMNTKQMYDYLVSQRCLSSEDQELLWELHKVLGKDKWD